MLQDHAITIFGIIFAKQDFTPVESKIYEPPDDEDMTYEFMDIHTHTLWLYCPPLEWPLEKHHLEFHHAALTSCARTRSSVGKRVSKIQVTCLVWQSEIMQLHVAVSLLSTGRSRLLGIIFPKTMMITGIRTWSLLI